jgi:hypothetical protein
MDAGEAGGDLPTLDLAFAARDGREDDEDEADGGAGGDGDGELGGIAGALVLMARTEPTPVAVLLGRPLTFVHAQRLHDIEVQQVVVRFSEAHQGGESKLGRFAETASC